ncbi:MAG: DUF1778 domain-containing protein [Burkholderiaceae bacterium]|nr:DUF1778 domain-containing protein [Burkholderiaceae bacterium]
MKNMARERARITLQISAALVHRLQEAADLRGMTLKHFLVETALTEANRLARRSAATRDAPQDAAVLSEPADDPH